MPDAEFFAFCKVAALKTVEDRQFNDELYSIVDTALAVKRIGDQWGNERSDEVRQDVVFYLITKTIPTMIRTSGNCSRINAHSYVYYAACQQVGQFIRKAKRRAGIMPTTQALNEELDRLLTSSGQRILPRKM